MTNNDTSHVTTRAAALRKAGSLNQAADLLRNAIRDIHIDNGHGRAEKADLFRELAEVHLRGSEWSSAHGAIDDALSVLGSDAKTSNRARWASLMERKAWTLFREGKLREAQTIAATLRQECEADDAAGAGVLASLHNTLGGIAWNEGRPNEAMDHVTRAAKLFEEAGDSFGAANARTNLGVLNYTVGRWSSASEAFAESERMRAGIDCVSGRAANLLNLGLLQLSMGDHAQARVNLEKAREVAGRAGERHDRSRAELALAQLDLLESRFDDVCNRVDTILGGRDCMCDDDVVQASWLKAMAECDRGGHAQGLALAEHARKVARDGRLMESEADCCRALASAYRCAEQYPEAESALREALEISSRVGDPYRRALALLDMATLTHVQGRGADARQNVDEAAKLFQELGAAYDLRRAESTRAQMSA